MTDAELIRKAQQGDRAALQTLYERYLPTVWRYAYAQTRGRTHLAEDVTSEAFLALVGQLHTLTPDGGALSGWLMGVVRHKLIDWSRRRALTSGPETDVEDGLRPCEASLEERELVTRAMDEMTDDERMALEWKYLEGLSVRVIAERTGRTEKAVESILFRARRSFRAIVDRLGGTEECHATT